jgi:CSLREA domain-containing protein
MKLNASMAGIISRRLKALKGRRVSLGLKSVPTATAGGSGRLAGTHPLARIALTCLATMLFLAFAASAFVVVRGHAAGGRFPWFTTGPGTLAFAGAPYTDSETNDHTFTVKVGRTGGGEGAALPVLICPTTLTVNEGGDAHDTSPGDGICDTDSGTAGDQCSLRAAIEEANALSSCGTITIDATSQSGTIALTLGELLVDHDVNINGQGANLLAVDGGNDSRVFEIATGRTVSISGLTVTNGNNGGNGGGILNGTGSTLTLTNTTVSGNTADGGGGIYNQTGATLALIDSMVSPNTANYGSGIYSGGTLTLTNSTVSGNTASGNGGGIFNSSGTLTLTNSTVSDNTANNNSGGGIDNSNGTLTLTNSTVSGNTANGAFAAGGGIYNIGGTVNAINTIIAGNSALTGPDISGNFTSQGHNLIGIGDGGTGFTGTGDQVGSADSPIYPRLGPLGANGGSTQTQALLGGSPAIDAGDNCVLDNSCLPNPLGFNLTTDQRGVSRPQGSRVDIGAFELTTFVVNTTADHPPDQCDALPGGDCTLREAINAANAYPYGLSRIAFDIPTGGSDPGCDAGGVCTTSPTLALGCLPAITAPVFIDGYSQGKGTAFAATPNTLDLDVGDNAVPKIQLSGNNLGPGSRGLDLQSGSYTSVVSGLIINQFSKAGIWIDNEGGNQISGNFIGTIADGTAGGVGNGDGVDVRGGGFSLIGGDNPADRNIISGNTTNGINIGTDGTGANAVEGNYIGIDKSGAVAIANDVGVYINDGTDSNVVGCEVINGDNLISGNTSAGVRIEGSEDNLVEGNFIGTEKTGLSALANGIGVDILDAPYNTVGQAPFGNLISGNTGAGVLVHSSSCCSPTTDTYVQNNRIGTKRTGTDPLPNDVGVVLRDTSYNLVGGTCLEDGNLISGNTHDGILIENSPSSSSPSVFNEVYGNRIGSDKDGLTAVANGSAGVELNGVTDNEVGCTVPGAGNLISGNTGDGVEVTGGAANNFVQGNFIGVQADFISALGNGGSGVEVYVVAAGGTTNNTIGAELLSRDVNRLAGRPQKNSAGAQANAVKRTARSVPRTLKAAKQSTSATPAKVRRPKGAVPRRITKRTNGNRFALAPAKDPKVATLAVAIRTTVSPPASTVKGGNIIANNGQDGVRVSSFGDIENLITGNSIYSNNGLGINLGTDGVTLNDPGDGDDGPNHLQNFPVITGAAVSTQTITGILHSQSDDFIIDFYANDDCDPSGYGEGKTYLGSFEPTTDGNGDAPFSFLSPVPFTANQIITATARDFSHNTSEFSRCFPATPTDTNSCPAPFVVNDTGDTDDVNPGDGVCANGAGACTLRAAIEEANATSASCGPIDISFNIGSATITLAQAQGELPVKHDVNVNGPAGNSIIVSGNNLTRLFNVNLGYTASISRLTLSGGNGSGGDGGAIQNNGILTLTNVILSGNSTTQNGGAVRNDGTLVLVNSTLSGNSALGAGGALVSGSGRFATVVNSTISGNTSAQAGGGINSTGWLVMKNSTVSGNLAAADGGGIYAGLGTATLTNVTLTNNRSDNDNNNSGDGGGIFVQSGNVLLHNTIVARNFKGGSPGTTAHDIAGSLDSQSSFNLIGDGTGMSGISDGPNSNQVGSSGSPIDPLLGALQDNGGPTLTHGLLYNSPAVDKGDNATTSTPLFLTTDQRGSAFARQSDGDLTPGAVVDIGAYERQATESRNIPGGTNAHVDLVDARLSFASVPMAQGDGQSGNRLNPDTPLPVTASISVIDPATQPAAPPFYVKGNDSSPPLPAFDVTVSGSYTAPVGICFYLPSITNAEFFSGLKILHNEGGTLVDVTTGQNFGAKIVCGNVNSFSAFVIAHSVTPTAANGNVSGQITDSNGNPLEGAAVRLSGSQDRLTVTDAAGKYRFDNVETNGFYTVIPSRANFSFSPLERSFSALGLHTEAAFNATPSGTALNPLDTTAYFVRQQYLDFLGREPDEAGLSFWINNIEGCGADSVCRTAKRIDTSAAFFLSIEFQQTGYLAYRTYQAAFGEMPGAPVPLRINEFNPDRQQIDLGIVVNQDGWQAALASNKRAYMAEYVQRPRFVAAYPNTMTPDEFVDKLFTNAGVTPAPNDRLEAVNEFGASSSSADAAARGRALQRVAENLTLQQQEFNRAFVLMQYFGYLRRDANSGPDPDFSGYNFWLNKLNSFNGNFQNAEMVKAFLVATEYRGRFPR